MVDYYHKALNHLLKQRRIAEYRTVGESDDRITVRAVKRWLDGALSGSSSPRKKRNALAMLSEIPTEKAAKLCAAYATAGPAETRVQALIALPRCIASGGSAASGFIPVRWISYKQEGYHDAG